jgi:hypothetical protein
MKAGKEHRVPLSDRAMTIVGPACVETKRDLRRWRIPPGAKLA